LFNLYGPLTKTFANFSAEMDIGQSGERGRFATLLAAALDSELEGGAAILPIRRMEEQSVRAAPNKVSSAPVVKTVLK